jgi:hypothetical protein
MQTLIATITTTPALAGVTPRGYAACALIRTGWLRGLAPGARTIALYGISAAVPGLTTEDRDYLAALVAEMQEG